MQHFFRNLVCGVLAVAACVTVQAMAISPQHAESFERKVGQINGPNRTGAATPVRTPVSEDELNSWFAYRAHPLLPGGVTAPRVSLVGEGRVTGEATLDLEAVGKRRSSGGWLDPWTLLGGRVPVVVTGTLQARNGMGQFALESASLAGVPMPTFVVQELLSMYSRSAARPRGVSLDDPFPLPANIRQIEVGRGQAVVVQ
jgi:hypothetical protein